MEAEPFKTVMEQLGAAFDKPMGGKAAMIAQYYDVIGRRLTDLQVDNLMAWAKRALERFPSIAQLRQHAIEVGYVQRPRGSTAMSQDEPLVVHCSCGEWWAVLRVDLLNDANTVYCPECHEAYRADALVKHEDSYGIATFTAAYKQPAVSIPQAAAEVKPPTKEVEGLWWQDEQENEK